MNPTPRIYKTERQQRAENWAREQADLGAGEYEALLRQWYIDHPAERVRGEREPGR